MFGGNFLEISMGGGWNFSWKFAGGGGNLMEISNKLPPPPLGVPQTQTIIQILDSHP